MLTMFDSPSEYANVIISSITCLCSMYLAVVMMLWWRRLRAMVTPFRPFFMAMCLVKVAIFYLSLNNIYTMLTVDRYPPLHTILARALLMASFIIMMAVTFRYYGGGKIMPQTTQKDATND